MSADGRSDEERELDDGDDDAPEALPPTPADEDFDLGNEGPEVDLGEDGDYFDIPSSKPIPPPPPPLPPTDDSPAVLAETPSDDDEPKPSRQPRRPAGRPLINVLIPPILIAVAVALVGWGYLRISAVNQKTDDVATKVGGIETSVANLVTTVNDRLDEFGRKIDYMPSEANVRHMVATAVSERVEAQPKRTGVDASTVEKLVDDRLKKTRVASTPKPEGLDAQKVIEIVDTRLKHSAEAERRAKARKAKDELARKARARLDAELARKAGEARAEMLVAKLNGDNEEAEAAVPQLVGLGPFAVDALIGVLKTGSNYAARYAIMALQHIDKPALAPLLRTKSKCDNVGLKDRIDLTLQGMPSFLLLSGEVARQIEVDKSTYTLYQQRMKVRRSPQ